MPRFSRALVASSTVVVGVILGGGIATAGEESLTSREEPEVGEAAGGACTAPAWSASSVYTGGNVVSFNGAQYTAAYWNQNAEPDKNSGAQYSGQPWGPAVSCSAPSCTPACSGKTCGSDGCGGTCGTCGSSQTCNASSQCVASCLPSCALKQCGSDGCGGTCGTCSGGLTCNPNNQCVSACVPSCSGKSCGGDGCGGNCGTCGSGFTCDASGACDRNAQTTPAPLAVALYPQQQTEWCWAAAGEMVMGYLGKSVQQCDEANYRFGLTTCCTDPNAAANLSTCNQPGWPDWSYWGFNFSETNFGTALAFAQLQTEFSLNRPVGFAWQWVTGGGHYMVATGTVVQDGVQYVTFNDPWVPNVGEQVTMLYTDWVAGPAGTDPTAGSAYTHMADDYGITKR